MNELYRDDEILVVVKPAGVVSETEQKGAKCVGDFYPGTRLYAVHRLDRETAGVMVYALSKKSAAELSAQIREGGFEKRYLAVLRGLLPEKEGVLRDLLVRDKARNITSVAAGEAEGAKEAELEYRIKGENQGLSIADIKLHTGRTHQIRVQFSSRSAPVYGDGKYGGGRGETALFAYSLTFTHPETGERMNFTAKPDEESFPWNLFAEEIG